jgi:hypothetical protein
MRIRLALLALALTLAAGPAAAQTRSAACASANDEVTRLRLGKDRNGRPNRIDLPKAVSVGAAAAARCAGDDRFVLAYALARIDLSGDVKRTPYARRTEMFNGAVADLEALKAKVLAGRSDRYEVFNVLGLVYYDVGQFDRSIAALSAGTPLLGRMTETSRRNTLVTLAMAQAQTGQSTKAAANFDRAAQAGYRDAQSIKQQMLGSGFPEQRQAK